MRLGLMVGYSGSTVQLPLDMIQEADRLGYFAVWTADWTAAPQDDLELIPNVHGNVFQKAFDTLEEQLGSGAG